MLRIDRLGPDGCQELGDDLVIRIDAHQHYWRIDAPWHRWPTADLPAIHRDFAPTDLAPLLADGAIDGSILVQSQPSDADTDALLALVETCASVLAVVGWVDMIDPTVAGRVAALAARPKLTGLRPMLQDLPADWILQDAAAPALAAMVEHDLVFDALIRPEHLSATAQLADRYPALTIVIDHAAKPDIAGDAFEMWSEALAPLAARPNTNCKLSGLVTEAGGGWSAAALSRYVDRILALFGPDRVLWGSDWPVVLLDASYAEWLGTAQTLVPHGMHDAVFGGTAARIYRIADR